MARFLTIAIALTLPALSGAAWAIPEDPYDDYQAGDFGRIRYEEHGVSVVRGTESSPGPTAEASVNAPVFPGDSIRTDLDQRTEIQLAGGTLVRVDHGTQLTFQSLPDPYADYVDNAVLKLASGVIQVSATLDGKEEFRIDTPDASIYLLGDGDFRIEVDDRGETRVFSRRGVAEVVGDGGSVLLRGGMRTTVWAGAIPDDPQPFNSFVTDPFDGWVEARAESYRTEETYAYTAEAVEAYDEIPTEVRPYYRELSAHGRWVYVPTYGYCWYPFDTPKDWRPYYNGYWDYGPGGYFWVSHEPWGWAPYHYGRWNWVSGYGWCWIPGRVFAGAWVSWSWGSAYVGWAPLDYWNRPAYIRTVYYDYYGPHSWTFVTYKHFGGGHGGHGGGHHGYRDRYGVLDVADDIRDTAVVTRPPRIPPRELADDPAPGDRVGRELNGRVPVVRKDARPETPFADTESDLIRRGRGGIARTRDVGQGGVAVRAETPSGNPRVDRPRPETPRPAAGGTAAAAAKRRSVLPARPRAEVRPTSESTGNGPRERATRGTTERSPRVTSESPSSARPSSATAERRGTPMRGRRTEPPETRRTGSGQTDDHLRELYRRMAEPRKTEQTGGSSSTKASSPPSGSSQRRTEARPSGRDSGSSRAEPRRGSPSSGSSSQSQKATPPSGSSSSQRQKAAPRGESSSSGSKAAPRGQSKSSGSKSSSKAKSSSGEDKSQGSKSGGDKRR